MPSPAGLFLPIVNWELRRQRPQQLARCFARSGDRVYYPFLRLHPDPPPLESGVWQIALRGRPVIGFFGGIHDWFDVPLVEELARLRLGWEIWLVGDTYRARVEPLRELANVTFFGEVPYGELPRLVSFFDVGIIQFRITPLTEATNPVMVYEMLAAGLPVVAVDLPELRSLRPPALFIRRQEN